MNVLKKSIKSHFWLILGLGTATLLYILCFHSFMTGYFTDDVRYILLAESLKNFRFETIYTVPPQPASDHFPGYPLFLMPFVALLGTAPFALKIISIILCLVSAILLAQLAKTKPPLFTAVAFLLFAFNSTLVRYSGTVMSEPLFIAVGLAGILLLKNSKKYFAVGAALLGWAALIKAQGIFLVGAAVLFFLIHKKYKQALILVAFGCTPLLLFLIRNAFLNSAEKSLFSYLLSFNNPDALRYYGLDLKSFLGMTFPGMLFEWFPFHNPLIRKILAWGSIVGTLALMTWGGLKNKNRLDVFVGSLFILSNIVLIPAWTALTIRYSLVLLPWISLLVVAGLQELRPKNQPLYKFALFILICVGINHIRGNINSIQAAQTTPIEVPAYLNWIQANTSSDKILMGANPALMYLHTQRKSIPYPLLQHEKQLHAFMRNKNISTIVMPQQYGFSGRHGSVTHTTFLNMTKWTQNKLFFQDVFLDQRSGVIVYQLIDASPISR